MVTLFKTPWQQATERSHEATKRRKYSPVLATTEQQEKVRGERAEAVTGTRHRHVAETRQVRNRNYKRFSLLVSVSYTNLLTQKLKNTCRIMADCR